MRAEGGAPARRDARQAEPGKVDGGDGRVQTLGQLGGAGLPADRVPTETVDEQHARAAVGPFAVAPLRGMHTEAVDVEPLLLAAVFLPADSSSFALQTQRGEQVLVQLHPDGVVRVEAGGREPVVLPVDDPPPRRSQPFPVRREMGDRPAQPAQ